MEVNFFVCLSYAGKTEKPNLYGVCIVYVTQSGKAAVKYCYGEMKEKVGFNQLTLVALVKAMEHLIKPCYITAYVKSKYIENMLNRGLPGQWEKNDWKNAKGEVVSCSEYWKRLLDKLNVHTLTFTDPYENEYTNEMERHLNELRRMNYESNCSSKL